MHDESTKQPCCNPTWEPPQVIPAQVRRVNNLIFRKINQFHRENNVDNVTPMHDWIMSYLYWHKNDPVYQRDIEREFSITRSTVTNILQLMERKGYIERQSVPQDARLKRLILTEEGGRVHEKTMLSLHQTDEFGRIADGRGKRRASAVIEQAAQGAGMTPANKLQEDYNR